MYGAPEIEYNIRMFPGLLNWFVKGVFCGIEDISHVFDLLETEHVRIEMSFSFYG